MSEASEVLAELQATVGLAKADRRADAWRWLDDIDRLASRLETALAADVQVAAELPPYVERLEGRHGWEMLQAARAEHAFVVIGDRVVGFRVTCPCGWRSDEIGDDGDAYDRGSTHADAVLREARAAQVLASWDQDLGPFGEDD